MDRQRGTARVELRALIFRPDAGYLILRRSSDPDDPWDLPGGPLASHTEPETVLRQQCLEQVGCCVQVLAGRPPFTVRRDGAELTYRLFLCAAEADEAIPLGCAAVRWVPSVALAEYRFAAELRGVLERLL